MTNKLRINYIKTKAMIFNNTGKMIKQDFFIDQKKIEIVQTFCYLGVDIKASGAVSTGMNALYNKARKAMRPIMGIIARFHISPKTSLNLFHTYISPLHYMRLKIG